MPADSTAPLYCAPSQQKAFVSCNEPGVESLEVPRKLESLDLPAQNRTPLSPHSALQIQPTRTCEPRIHRPRKVRPAGPTLRCLHRKSALCACGKCSASSKCFCSSCPIAAIMHFGGSAGVRLQLKRAPAGLERNNRAMPASVKIPRARFQCRA